MNGLVGTNNVYMNRVLAISLGWVGRNGLEAGWYGLEFWVEEGGGIFIV